MRSIGWTINDMQNSCVLQAFYVLSDHSESHIMDVCKSWGYNPKRGMSDHCWKSAAWQLGFELENLTPYLQRRVLASGKISKGTVGRVSKAYCKTGKYLVLIRRHMIPVENGVICVPNDRKHPGKQVEALYRIKQKSSDSTYSASM